MALWALASSACGDDKAGPGPSDASSAVSVVDTVPSDLTAPSDLAAPAETSSAIEAAAESVGEVPDAAVNETLQGDEATVDSAPDAFADAAQADSASPLDAAADATGVQAPPCTKNADCPDPQQPCAEARCEVATKSCKTVQSLDTTACTDGEPCTVGDSCLAGQCVSGPKACGCTDAASCAFLDDADLCNGQFYCNTKQSPAVCAAKPGSVVKCPPSGSACQIQLCNPISGACAATPTNDGGPCEDGKICTDGDACSGGQCVAGADACPCKKNSDCTDDGNLCNGTPYCDKTELPWACKTNPGTVVNCSAASDTPCSANQCNAKTGTCAYAAVNAGGKCEDGQVCTVSDTCDNGVCAAGPNQCGCIADADCAKVEDNDLCNGTLFCNKSVAPHLCQINPATVVVCPTAEDTKCKNNLCNPASGKCVFSLAKDASSCDDNNPCTVDDACEAGLCKAKTNVCPCSATADCATKDDGDLCNGILYCDKSKLPYGCLVNPATLVTCPSVGDTACLKNACAKASGKCSLTAVSNGQPCDADGSSCTVGDGCKAGACNAGPNTCNCGQDADCASQEDGNVCNGSLFCDKNSGTCKVNPNTVVACSPVADSTCLANQCQPTTGKCAMSPRNQGQSCDADGNPCTEGDNCAVGTCSVGVNTCACTANADCALFEDGNACNGLLYCDKTKLPFQCKVNPATVKNCGAGNPPMCQKYGCDPKIGVCANLPVVDQSPCEDGTLCTFGDACVGGQCAPGSELCQCYQDSQCASSEDGNLCNGTLYCDKTLLPFACKVAPATVVVCAVGQDNACLKATCQAATGHCALKAVANGGVCIDGNPCTSGDACSSGKCVGGEANCSDGDNCTYDDCDVIDGCLHLGNAAAACDDGNGCTNDACDAKSGCTYAKLPSGPCDDFNPCTLGDSCQAGVCAGGSAGGCDDGNPCTDDACASTGKACVHQNNVATCGLGRLCFQGQCGGCEAWRRIARWGCSEVLLTGKAYDTGACKYLSKNQRDELEDAALATDATVVSVGAASTDGSQKTKAWAVWQTVQGQWQFDRTYAPENVAIPTGSDRLLAAAAAGKGQMWLAGMGQSSSPSPRPWLFKVDGSGAKIVEILLPPPVGTLATDKGQFDDVVGLGDGGALAVGRIDNEKAGAADALLTRVDANAKVVWSKTVGQETGSQTAVIDHLWAVALAPDGQSVVAVGQRGNPKAASQQQDGWVLRADLNGNILWSKSFATSGWEALYDVTANADGSWSAVGVHNKSNPLAAGDGWLLHLAGTGASVGQTSLPDKGGEVVRVIAARANGGWLLGGTRTYDHTGNSGWLANNYDTANGWAVALDASGKVLWDNEFDQYAIEKTNGGCGLPSGDLVLAGDSRVKVSTIYEKTDMPDGLLLRINGATGKDGCPCDFFTDLAAAPTQADLPAAATLDGNAVLAAGHLRGDNGFDDGWLHAVAADGTLLWNKTISKPDSDRFDGLARGPNGTYLAVGGSDSGGAGKMDGWLVLVDSSGKVLADKVLGGSEDDYLLEVAALPNGGWVAVGYTYSASKGLKDGWMIGVDEGLNLLWEHRQGDVADDVLRGVAIVGWGKTARALAIGFRTVVKGGLDGEDQMVTVVEQNGQIAIGKDGKPLQYFFDRVTGINGANQAVDEPNAVARLDNGTAVAVGRGTYSALPSVTISRFGATGERTSEVLMNSGIAKVSSFPNSGILLGVIALADNGFVAYGMSLYTAQPGLVGPSWAQRYSANDQFVWQQTSFIGAAVVGKVRLLAGVRLAGNQLVLTGTSEAKDGARNGVVVRVDAVAGQTSADLVALGHNSPCKPALCDVWLGARPVNQTGGCDDLNRCQDVDRCVDGQCVGAAVHNCSDGNPCTAESCTASAGCLVAEGKPGVACTTSDLCSAGNCGPCPWTQSLWGAPKINEFTMAAAPAVQGGFWLVGYHNSTSSAGNQTGCWIARTDAAAQPIAQQALNLAVSAEESLLGVAALSDGGAWAAGWINTKGTAAADRNMLLVRVDPSGVPVKVVAPDLPAEQAWLSVAAGTSGQWVAVGFTSGAGGHIAAAQAMDATGTVQWTYASPAANTELVDVTATSDGGWVLAGHDGIKNLAQAVRVDGSGKVQWTATAAGVGQLFMVRIVALANGGFLAAAHDLSGGAQLDTRIVVWSATGTLTANALTQFDANQWVRDLKVVGNQVVAVGTVLNTYGVSAGLAAGFSLQGQLLWSSALTGPDWLSFGALLTTAQGLPMAIGDQSATLTAQVVVRTFSPQGQFFCGP